MPSNRHHHRESMRHKQTSEHKPTRVRTVLNEKQLNTLRTCYNANPRPDALMKEHLVEMTGLSPRVIRVWFQNKRCKDKKRMILTKQMEQQAKVSPSAYRRLRPLVAGQGVDGGAALCPEMEVLSARKWIRRSIWPQKKERQRIGRSE